MGDSDIFWAQISDHVRCKNVAYNNATYAYLYDYDYNITTMLVNGTNTIFTVVNIHKDEPKNVSNSWLQGYIETDLGIVGELSPKIGLTETSGSVITKEGWQRVTGVSCLLRS